LFPQVYHYQYVIQKNGICTSGFLSYTFLDAFYEKYPVATSLFTSGGPSSELKKINFTVPLFCSVLLARISANP